jgi:hypothetical protein
MLHQDYDGKGSVGKKSLFLSLKGIDPKTNCLALNRQSQSNFDLVLSCKSDNEEKTLCVL